MKTVDILIEKLDREVGNVVWKQGDSRESYQALVKQFRAFVDTAKPGDTAVLPVAICTTTRVVYDPIDRVVLLPCKAVIRGGENYVSICPCPPRYPQGIHPGVLRGLWLLASHDMRPMPSARRRRHMGRWS